MIAICSITKRHINNWHLHPIGWVALGEKTFQTNFIGRPSWCTGNSGRLLESRHLTSTCARTKKKEDAKILRDVSNEANRDSQWEINTTAISGNKSLIAKSDDITERH
ncbi:hypothetical protein BJ508DRAFT_337058 [Ascobolus immersus RN42]|uniref:Uncharacterized protein n=1 Tax=Ascobolus immersus RN42 TaxID=1160509 RepID=A0A3N4HAK2_ASCIM|nr:hypothetical protein BJ508DRAFT_337058 [Ascobolus immersus RN42]